MSGETVFADIILPLAIPKLYTYRVPRDMEQYAEPGKRAVVQFGRGTKLYSSVIKKLHHVPPSYEAKYIEDILDSYPVVNGYQFKLWEWMQDYYMCAPGEVMNAALPGGMKLASETRIVLNPSFDSRYEKLSDDEFLVTEALETQEILSLEEIAELLQKKNVHPIIKSLIEKRVILVEEEMKDRYKPKKVSYVRLTEKAAEESRLREWFDRLEKAPRQLETLMTHIHLSGSRDQPKKVKKTLLQKKANASSSVVKTLEKKGIFEIYEEQTSRVGLYKGKVSDSNELNAEQESALSEVKEAFAENKVALLHGVTSSGKTEVYIKLIEEALDRDEQVLYLLPEIAITTQIIDRLRKHFGNRVGVYHSRFNDNERVETWNTVLDFKPGKKNKFQIILGARSSIFLPFQNLGLIIVDEEHENTYKQYDPAPRYHAGNTAVILSMLHKGHVLLGSATPSVESYHNAVTEKYSLVEMKRRYGNVRLPEVLCADVKEETRKKKMKSHFTSMLLDEMREVLENKEQVILFQNRRGYSPFMICDTCGNSPQCKNCDVSLTYHKAIRQLKCHYCGYGMDVPDACPDCGSTDIHLKGFGTEKIEEELSIFFPGARVSRMDLDTTRAKKAYHKIITEFEEGRIDILVGTQMVTKGLDFDNVALVGVLNADNMLNFPDFRAFERSYQLMAQVSGRAGRKKKRGKVIIQTRNPGHSVIQKVIRNDYRGMYKDEVLERRNFHYPPFVRLISLTVKHKRLETVNPAAEELVIALRKSFGAAVLGPQFPSVPRIRNYYHKNILIKVHHGKSLPASKKAIASVIDRFKSKSKYKSARIVIDVDPR